MESVDSLSNSGLYFQVAQEAAKSQQAEKDKIQKKEKVSKSKFSSALEKSYAEHALFEEGLPVEIAKMSEEEAVVFLKDAADMAADVLKEKQTVESFADYRKKVSQFLKYISKNNYEVIKHQRKGFTRKRKPVNPSYEVRVINEDLDFIARSFLLEHKAPLNMLAKIEEISGLIIDLMAT